MAIIKKSFLFIIIATLLYFILSLIIWGDVYNYWFVVSDSPEEAISKGVLIREFDLYQDSTQKKCIRCWLTKVRLMEQYGFYKGFRRIKEDLSKSSMFWLSFDSSCLSKYEAFWIAERYFKTGGVSSYKYFKLPHDGVRVRLIPYKGQPDTFDMRW